MLLYNETKIEVGGLEEIMRKYTSQKSTKLRIRFWDIATYNSFVCQQKNLNGVTNNGIT